MSTLRKIAAVSSLWMVTGPALAASDYLLELGSVKGESAAAPQSIEVESFSWGASNAGTAAASSSGGHGKVNVQEISMTKARSPRDASSGMASGKRTAAETGADGQTATAAPGVGTHFPKAVVVARGQRIEFSDVVETACTVTGGQTRKEFKGHVTLLK
jgi:Type VI secretion system effector, Hcp